ncbi:late embryogenesis abundant protein-related / LEA protein-like protein [Thalictrum thalictroides]|uniref:Late embryogenesis abundant protein-related / LEA protein-like protein n=1 Tax=Thalictrum thalictroides TaxID=46969 RepID=A0A7J6V9G1_THATH|nr:late embryogenesis abundant protein-related / LEA protein-like protein [Thalictrum thalictroides]
MKNMKSYLFVAFFVVLVSMEVAIVLADDSGNGNGNANEATGQERGQCKTRGSCFYKTLECPKECPDRKPKNNKAKGCFIDCARKPSCEGYGSVCYDPRFVGGDGRVFYFHGSKGGDFALFSDDDLQINANNQLAFPFPNMTCYESLNLVFNFMKIVIKGK